MRQGSGHGIQSRNRSPPGPAQATRCVRPAYVHRALTRPQYLPPPSKFLWRGCACKVWLCRFVSVDSYVAIKIGEGQTEHGHPMGSRRQVPPRCTIPNPPNVSVSLMWLKFRGCGHNGGPAPCSVVDRDRAATWAQCPGDQLPDWPHLSPPSTARHLTLLDPDIVRCIVSYLVSISSLEYAMSKVFVFSCCVYWMRTAGVIDLCLVCVSISLILSSGYLYHTDML